jgi:hypothetical protein
MTTVRSSPTTDEMGETPRVAHVEAVYVLASRVREERGPGAHGTPNCCHEHAEQNL